MLKTDLVARNGVFVHVVDRILYSEWVKLSCKSALMSRSLRVPSNIPCIALVRRPCPAMKWLLTSFCCGSI